MKIAFFNEYLFFILRNVYIHIILFPERFPDGPLHNGNRYKNDVGHDIRKY